MDAEIKQKWVKALRSGEYEQGFGTFEDEGKFCCLGVLCVVAGEPTITRGEQFLSNWNFVSETIDGLPYSLGRIAKIDTLVTMNDGGIGFPEIADFIEREL